MSSDNRDLVTRSGPGIDESADGGQSRARVNWVLALLTVPGAAIVMLFALGAVMSTNSCTESR